MFKSFKQFLKESAKSDGWLKRYTLEGVDKWPTKEVLDDLQKDYPFEGGTLYRGLNFHDKEQYEDFLSKTKDGTILETGGISSWSPSRRTSLPFAITRPTYFLNRELMQAEDLKNKNHDYMIGHAGVILKINVPKNVGIDVRQSKFAKEDEVILPEGSYKIDIDETLLPFMKSITKENFKDHFMKISNLTDESEHKLDKQKFSHIMFHYNEFDNEMKHHLFKLIEPNISNAKYAVTVEKADYFGEKSGALRVEVAWNLWFAVLAYYDILLPQDRKQIELTVKKLLAKIDAEVESKLSAITADVKVEYRIYPEIKLAAGKLGIEPKFLKRIYKLSGERYQKLNSRESLKVINSLSGREREKAMDDYMASVLASLSAFDK